MLTNQVKRFLVMKKSRIALLAALAVTASPAFADLSIVGIPSAPPASVANHPASGGKVADSGVKPAGTTHEWIQGGMTVIRSYGHGEAGAYKGFGRMGLVDAVKMIAPVGWHVDVSRVSGEAAKPVSFRSYGGQSWIQVMQTPLYQAGVSASVFWDKKKVVINDSPSESLVVMAAPPSATQVKVAPAKVAETKPKAIKVNAVKANASVITASNSAPVGHQYTIPPGPSLSRALDKYVVSMGWNGSRWLIDSDYRVDAPIPMNGDLVSAITNLVKTYQAQGGMMGVTPLFAEANKIVVFRKMDRSPSQISVGTAGAAQ